MPDEPEVLGLLALLELTAARFPARTGPDGDPVLLEHQDRRRWDRAAIRRGRALLTRAERAGRGLGAYGLQAAIFTTNLPVALRAARELDFGGVLVNEVPTYRADQMPYGGVRDSRNTREGPRYAVHEMTEQRLVILG